MTHARTRIVLAALVAVALAGCRSGPAPVNYVRPYPTTLTQGPGLDIQVIRGETTLTLTNATAKVFGPSTIWINSYYSRPIEGMAIGQSFTFRLTEFRNEHGEPFRGGGFFATKKPERMVLAELESDGTMYRMVVIRGEPVIK